MNQILVWVRSIIFTFVLYVGTLVLCVVFVPTLFMTCKMSGCFPRFWSRLMSRMLAWICGVKINIEGLENLPEKDGYIVASKHQSAMETLLFHAYVPHTFYVLKRELLWLPLAGLYFFKTGCVAIDRAGGAKTMRKMLIGVQKHLAQGMNLVIFPEGTRTRPGDKKPYSPGVAFLYEQCKVPVVPVALNSGYCWPKNSTKKHAGTVTVRFLPPIEAGMDKRAFLKTLNERIETAQDQLPDPFGK